MVKRALVTGASEGIGRVFAERLAAQGANVTAVARNEKNLTDLIAKLGPNHRYIVADLATIEGQNRIAAEFSKEHFDLLINNAGVGAVGDFTDLPVDQQIRVVQLNCDAVVRLAHAFLLNSRTGDALLNVSSALAFMPMPTMAIYCATKAFVTSFSESLWYEQKTRGVYVMGLCPGVTSTNFTANSGGRSENIPKNMAQTPEEVVETALDALECRREPTVISGKRNQIFAAITKVIPRKSTVSMMGKMIARSSSH